MLSKEEKQAVIDLFPFLGERPVIFDCGSNKGDWAKLFLDEYKDKCELHLFEPNEKLLSYTEIRFEYNSNVVYLPLAVYREANKTLKFYYFENFNNELSSIYKGNKEWDGLPMKESNVVTTSLDEYVKYYNGIYNLDKIDFAKLDLEGSEVDALIGCDSLLSKDVIKLIQIEYSEHYKRGNHTFDEILDIANKYSYKVYKYIDGNFWEVGSEFPFDNYYITKYEIHNYSVGGWNNEFVKNTLDLERVDLVLEIGAFEGITTKYIYERLLNDNADARIVCVDPMEDYYIEGDTEHKYFKNQYQRFLRNTRGLSVELKRGKSENELPKLNELRFGLIYIDGDHREMAVYFDCCWAFAVCKPNGHIIIDDYTWREETKNGIDKFLNEFQGFYDLIIKDYQVMIRKVTDHYNHLTERYYL